MKLHKNLKDKKCIIFDFDKTIGTIIIDWEGWRKKLYEIIKKYDPEFDGEIKDVRLGQENDYSRKYGDDFEREALREVEYFEQKNITDVIPNEQILLLIKSLKYKKLFLWTSNTFTGIGKYLVKFGIEKSFEKIITKNELRYKKPDPEGFYLIKEKEYPLSSYILIGDSVHDENAAKNAGIDFMNVDEL
jgi:HAD superfamily hydrolase (TIGR01549 family)